jgi:NADH-quinone oxidoreductase subunit H
MIGLAYWAETSIKVGLAAVVVPTGAAVAVYLFLFKLISFMQSRLGPMEAGPHGTLQLVAEVGKWLQKEDIIPDKADKVLFKLPPFIILATTFLMFVVIPAGPTAIVSSLPVGIFYVLAVSSISVIGILIAGWASANKYALIGGIRAAGQLIAYELPMILAVVGVVIQAGTLNMQEIVYQQSGGEIFGLDWIGNPYILTQFVGFIIFLVAIQAELGQTPFDMPVAESEVVGGYLVEYTGIRFLVFFLSEFAAAVGFSAIAATLFLGGWQLPESWGIGRTAMHFIGPLVIFGKAIALTGVIFWVRFSMPRLREDQLQRFAWKFLIPASLANIAITAILKVAV